MGSLLIVTGPPGAGKSTIAQLLAGRVSPSVLVEGDAFYAFLASGAIPPWQPASRRQNSIVARAAARATAVFVAEYATVYEGVLGPWQLEEFTAAGGVDRFDYVILLPPVEVCVERVATRVGHGFSDEAAARHMHAEFTRAVIEPRHVVTEVVATPADMVDLIEARRVTGTFHRAP